MSRNKAGTKASRHEKNVAFQRALRERKRLREERRRFYANENEPRPKP